jgi:uncharacterized Zn-binding protein involved in type VI secretion
MTRNRLVKSRGAGLATLGATVAMLAAAATAQNAASAASGVVPFHELTAGSRGFEMPGESTRAGGQVVRSAAQAAALLRAWGLDVTAAKSVNFARENAIVAMAAYQPTGGYRLRVSRVQVRGREAVVTGRVRYEGGQLMTQSTERPWVVIAVKRTSVARVRKNVQVKLR